MLIRSIFHTRVLSTASLLAGLIFLATLANPVSAQDAPETPETTIYFFWGEGCPHCAAAHPFLESLAAEMPGVALRDFQVYDNPDNQALFAEMAATLGFQPRAVPTIIIGDRYWEGYSERTQPELRAAVQECLDNGCPDAGAGIISEETGAATPIITPEPGPSATEPAPVPEDGVEPSSSDTLTLPIIGVVDLGTQSLAVSTLIIAFVDGFNPCSLWVLSMLLALTLHTGSRRKVLVIGLVFISVTALVYALFIAGLFSLFTYIRFMGWIQVVIALLAFFFAAVNIKDYFWYKEGLSFTIADQKKTGIVHRIRGILNSRQSIGGLIAATVAMAAGVSLVEFSCTAGFPVLWTNLVAAQNVQTPQFLFLLFLYMLVYQIDELAIFLAAVFTLKASRLEEKEGRILKLVGGMLMLTLAVVMLVNPAWMNSLGASLLIFAIAFGAALLVLLVHRRVLPAAGVWIGTEKKSRKRHRAKS